MCRESTWMIKHNHKPKHCSTQRVTKKARDLGSTNKAGLSDGVDFGTVTGLVGLIACIHAYVTCYACVYVRACVCVCV